MKKILNVFLCISLLFQSFAFATFVYAEEVKKEAIEINEVMQNEQKLKVIDGVYQVSDVSQIKVSYTIKNPKVNINYSLEVKYSNGNGYSSMYSNLTEDYKLEDYPNPFDMSSKMTTVVYNLFNDDTKELLDTKKVNMIFTKFEEYNLANSNLYIEKIEQGGKEVLPANDGTRRYILNKNQDVIFTIKGENFNENLTYALYNDSHKPIGAYSGKELKKGLNITIPIYDKDSYYINIGLKYEIFNNSLYAKPKECGESLYCSLNLDFSDDVATSSYKSDLSYTKYQNEKIKSTRDFNEYYSEYYLVSSRYHNKDNSLSVTFNGNNYLDKDYDILVSVYKGGEAVYKNSIKVNGLLLNKGYIYELKNFISSSDKTYIEDKDLYRVETNIDHITQNKYYMYGFSKNYSTIDSEIFFENGKKNLSTFRGDGNFYFNAGFADTNINVFKKYNNIYLRYLGKDFEDNITYDYKFSYVKADNGANFEQVKVLEKGKITGSDLNKKGLSFEASNPNNYRYPSYRLEVSYNGEIIYYSSPILDLVNTPTFANTVLSNANNKDLYLRMNDYSYIATRNFPINLAISGIGFDDKTNYKVTSSESYTYKDGKNITKENEYTFTGKQLNDGTATINFKQKITDDIVKADFYAMYSLGSGFGQGGFTINFVDSKDFFPTNIPYYIDNGNDLIKDIKGKTSVKDFANNLKVNQNGKVKIYDKTGTTEQKDYVGTGMIARITDEYDNSIIDLDVVVKGDVSGDGNISITDLVKMKQHVSEVKKLDGVYELAGKITEKDEIGITDLVKICQSVVNDEVI